MTYKVAFYKLVPCDIEIEAASEAEAIQAAKDTDEFNEHDELSEYDYYEIEK
jgi:hypothetical protein